jgi:hypothetical protein
LEENEPAGLRPPTGVTGSVDPQTPAFFDATAAAAAAAAECHGGAVSFVEVDFAPKVLAANISIGVAEFYHRQSLLTSIG